MQKLLSLTQAKFKTIAYPVLCSVAEYGQDLPETRNTYYAGRGGFVDYALERTATALKLIRGHMIPAADEDSELTEPQCLWVYALFTAGLLRDCGKLVSDIDVKLFNRSNQQIGTWQPLKGSMLTQGVKYDYDFLPPATDPHRNAMTLWLARQLMPAEGLAWLKSDERVFITWIALLQDERHATGVLGPVLWRAEAMVIQSHLEALQKLLAQRRGEAGKYGRLSTFSKTEDGLAHGIDDEALLAAQFLEWLREQIADESFELDNDENGVHVVPEGLLITDEAFSRFVDKHPQAGGANMVREAMSGMEVHVAGGGQSNVQNYLQIGRNIELNGMVLTNLDLVTRTTTAADFTTRGTTSEDIRISPHRQSNYVQMPTAAKIGTQALQLINQEGKVVSSQQVQTRAPVEPTKF